MAWRLSERVAQGAASCSLNAGPYCKARQRLPLPLIERLATAAGERIEAASAPSWRWRGRAVKLLDGTTVSMPDTPANQAEYPQSGEQQPGLGFPLAMLVALIALSTGAVLRWATGPCRGKGASEQALFRSLMPHLLGAIGLMILPIRPGRVEPHAIKRRPKNHALLTVPRRIARERIMQMRAAWA